MTCAALVLQTTWICVHKVNELQVLHKCFAWRTWLQETDVAVIKVQTRLRHSGFNAVNVNIKNTDNRQRLSLASASQ